jgi:hypothetical protein
MEKHTSCCGFMSEDSLVAGNKSASKLNALYYQMRCIYACEKYNYTIIIKYFDEISG